MERTYKIVHENERVHIHLSVEMKDLPFNVWRDVLQHSYCSTGGSGKNIVFMMVPESQEKAEKILQGALFTRKDS